MQAFGDPGPNAPKNRAERRKLASLLRKSRPRRYRKWRKIYKGGKVVAARMHPAAREF